MAKTQKVLTRQEAVKELIKAYSIENQSTLVHLLKEKYNIESTQSLVSRDLRTLEVSKRKYKGSLIYELKDIDISREILHLAIKDVTHNESLIIVKTLLGLSAFVCTYLDSQNEPSILGTLAGVDAIFVAPTSTSTMKKTFEAVCTLLHFKQDKKSSDSKSLLQKG